MKASRFPYLSLTLALLVSALTACAHPVDTATAPAATPVIVVDDAPVPAPVTDNKSTSFLEWTEVQQFMDSLIAKHGFEREQLEKFFGSAQLTERTIQLMRPAPPGKPKDWQAYRARFIEPVRIEAGRRFWNEHEQALSRAEAMYGVPPEIIVGIIGVETLYGKYTGRFRVPDVLTTLAFAYPDTPNRASRMDYFRGEVENVLLLARERQIDPFTLTGSYAGAIGLPQFMPGSIRQYAVDFDGDGRINLLESPVDAIGSVANYLRQHGWRPGEPFAFPAQVSPNSEEWSHLLKQGLVAKNTIDELRQSGVHTPKSAPADLRYGLVNLQNGTAPTEYWLGTPNFFAITHYNRSYFYAMAVIHLGEAIKRQRPLSSVAK
jgi:membrane-bound lytic murein transglycosylase B